MKVLSSEGGASHTGPESCVVVREGRGEALTGEGAGRVFSREIDALGRDSEAFWGADAVMVRGGRDLLTRSSSAGSARSTSRN